MKKEVLKTIQGLLGKSIDAKNDDTFSELKPSDLFCEGWLTSILLQYWKTSDLELDFLPVKNGKTKWAREVLLRSPFEKFGVGTTNSDAVVGHFDFREGTKRGIELDRNAKQFVVLEAKTTSVLTAGTTHWEKFDQATRNVADMAREIRERKLNVEDDFDVVDFIVISAEKMKGKHDTLLRKDKMKEKIEEMIEEISNGKNKRSEQIKDLEDWQENYFKPLVEKIEPRCVTWESIIEEVEPENPGFAKWFGEFYRLCIGD